MFGSYTQCVRKDLQSREGVLGKISRKELRLNLGHWFDRVSDCSPLPVHLISLLNRDNTQRTFVSLIQSQSKVACPVLFRKSLVICDL